MPRLAADVERPRILSGFVLGLSQTLPCHEPNHKYLPRTRCFTYLRYSAYGERMRAPLTECWKVGKRTLEFVCFAVGPLISPT
jgi:hypothetical protein